MADAVNESTIQAISLFELISQTGEQLYLVVDRILIPEFDEFWDAFTSRPDCEWQWLYQGAKLRAFKAGSPIVVPIENGSPGETLYYWLLEQGDYRQRFGFIICSTLSLVALTEQLRQWALMTLPNEQQVLFRFFDPRVLRQAWPVLSEQQKAPFMHHISAIYLPDSGDLAQPLQKLVIAEADEHEKIQHDEPLQLTQHQYDLLFYDERLAAIIRVLTEKLRQQQSVQIDIEWVTREFMAGLAQGKARYPHRNSLAYETYALYRFYLAGDFDLHPEFQQILKFNDLRAAIGRFYRQFKQRPEALVDYQPLRYESPTKEES